MTELYYMPSVKLNAKTSELVIPGEHIKLEGYQFERLRSKPRGRSRLRNLINMDSTTKLVIYS